MSELEFEINQRFITKETENHFKKFNDIGNEVSFFLLNIETFLSATNTYQTALNEISSSLGNLASSVEGDTSAISTCGEVFSRLSDYHIQLRETMLANVVVPLQEFTKEKMDITELENLNAEMDQVREAYNDALEWFPQNPKKKRQKKELELNESKVMLLRSTTGLLKNIEALRRDAHVEMMTRMKSFMLGFNILFRKSHEATKEVIKDFPEPDVKSITPIPLTAPHQNEGYLFKMHKSNYKLFWCVVQDNEFTLYKNWKNCDEIVEVFNLELCSVKPIYESKYQNCFFVNETVKQKVMFKAPTDKEFEKWINILQEGIADALSGPVADSKRAHLIRANSQRVMQTKAMIEKLWDNHPSNRFCVDCGSPNPKWISINLGVIFCINCSGVHRSMGAHISKVRSLAMDTLSDYLYDMLLAVNNEEMNSIFEYHDPESSGVPKITVESSREEREVFIRTKYDEKRFVNYPEDTVTSNELLVRSVSEGNIPGVLRAIAEGANPNLRNDSNKYILHLAVTGDPALVMALCLGGAGTNVRDDSGRSPLHHAFIRGMVGAVKVLVDQGADPKAVDIYGNDILAIADQLKEKKYEIPNLDELIELIKTVNEINAEANGGSTADQTVEIEEKNNDDVAPPSVTSPPPTSPPPEKEVIYEYKDSIIEKRKSLSVSKAELKKLKKKKSVKGLNKIKSSSKSNEKEKEIKNTMQASKSHDTINSEITRSPLTISQPPKVLRKSLDLTSSSHITPSVLQSTQIVEESSSESIVEDPKKVYTDDYTDDIDLLFTIRQLILEYE